MRAVITALILITLVGQPAEAGQIAPRQGWRVIDTKQPFATLVTRLDAAVSNKKMGLVNFASASDGAKAQGIAIPGNRVVGVYRNDFARRMLAASLVAGIEAPIRFYLVENADGTSTLAYKRPTTVFRPYFKRSAPDLKKLASELDVIFNQIAEEATSVP